MSVPGPPRKAMILAAGEGTRLRPITAEIPKGMVPVAGKPVLEHAVERLARFGVQEIVINLCHLPGVIQEHFGDGRRWGVHIIYSEEPRALGTAGGVRRVRWFFDRPSYIWYGDNLSTCDLARLYAAHCAARGVATIALFHREDPWASGVAELGPGDRIVRFVEKPRPGHTTSRWVNAGIYVIEPAFVEAIPEEGTPDFGKDIFPPILAQGLRLTGYRMSPAERVWWIDTPDDLVRVRAEVSPEALQAQP